MRFRRFRRDLLLIAIAAFFVLPQTAFAYIDPGTGSYILQVALAGLLGIVVALRNFWAGVIAKVKRLLGIKPKETPEAAEAAAAASGDDSDKE